MRLREYTAWQNSLAPGERVSFGLGMLQKPYAKDALELIPKFIAKYKQISFVTRTMKRAKQGIVGFGKNSLGDFLQRQ